MITKAMSRRLLWSRSFTTSTSGYSSHDPYIVLQLPKTATSEEIKQ